MSTTTNLETAPRDRGSVDHRLARLLDTPFLARVVPHLAPETLHQLIQYRGLEACGELVTSATPAQLTSLFDLDLGATRSRDATNSSMSIASANGSKCWWTPETRWQHAPSPPSTSTW